MLEHEVKALLREFGVAVPRGEFAPIPALAAEAADRIGYPVVVKAQVHGRGRYAHGGIADAHSAREVREVGAAIMTSPILGELPEGLLVEELVAFEAASSLTLAVDAEHVTAAWSPGEATCTARRVEQGRVLQAWVASFPLPAAQRKALAAVIGATAACAIAHGLAAVEVDPLVWTGAAYVAVNARATASGGVALG